MQKFAKMLGNRSLSKLLFNSLWGRLGMRMDKTKKVFIHDENTLLRLMINPSYDVSNFYELSDDALLVSYKLKDECEEVQSYVNVVLVAYTTALARIHLYGYLDKLQERCLYYDTDSVIFTCDENEECLPLGDNLGDLTDEVREFGENSYISEAVFSSEKSYGLIVKTPYKDDSTIVKCKGIDLNYENSLKINFDSIKNLVLKDQSKKINLGTRVILRQGDSTVYATNQEYTFSVKAYIYFTLWLLRK